MSTGHPAPVWDVHSGTGPLIATAIHDGHEVREELNAWFGLDEAQRLREEDPFTGVWAQVAPTRVVGLRSRFELDLNRPRDGAIYRKPEDAWGLKVWKKTPPAEVFERSLAEYDRFYKAMKKLLEEHQKRYGRFVVFDLHTYNHRRDGPDGEPADPEGNPQVNIGTGTMDRKRWAPVVDAFIDALGGFEFPGGRLDVRENVKFRGGQWSRWIHETFPSSGISLAIEFKKFFMDEWTGEPDKAQVDAIGEALRSTVPAVLAALKGLPEDRI